MRKYVLLLLAAGMANMEAWAQKTALQGITYGPEVGFNLSGGVFIKDPGTTVTGTPGPGFTLGGFADIPLSGSAFSIRPRLQYAFESYTPKIYGNTYPTHVSFIKIPINVVYHSSMGHDKWFFGAGPYLGIGVAGKYDFYGQESTIHFGSDSLNDQGKRFDVGIDLLAGYKLKDNIILSANLNVGVINVINASYWGPGCSSHTINFGITGAYVFGKP